MLSRPRRSAFRAIRLMPLLLSLWVQLAAAAIQDLRVGDQVLALAEWKAPGEAKSHEGKRLDARLSYEKVLDIVTSHREQTLVHLSLSNGDKLTATEGHPFKTTDGWRDAILLKKGGKLLLRAKGDEPPGVRVADSDGVFPERVATITEIRIERLTVPVFNLEVAHAHTFYVGADGALVHNGRDQESPPPRGGPPGGKRTKKHHRGRAIWDLPGGSYCYWDGYEDEWEVFNKSGKHEGTMNPDGSPRNGPKPGRRGPKK